MIKDKFEMERSALVTTYKCNLKCKLCGAYAPYYDNPQFFSLDYLTKAIDKYFNIVTYVKKFTITGGEPLLHPEIADVVKHTLDYSDKIGTIEIITNGTLVPSENLIEVLKQGKSKIKFLVDNYGDISKKIKEIDMILAKNNVNYSIRNYHGKDTHCGGWVNMIDLSQKHFNKEDIQAKYSKCAYPQKLKFCFIIRREGEMHPCPPSHRCMELKYIPKNRKEYIDLFDEGITIKEQRDKIMSILNSKSLSACAFCNGMCEDSERFMPAEQL